MPTTLVVEPEPMGERRALVEAIVRLARRLGPVEVLARPAADLGDADRTALAVADFCRHHPDVEHVIVGHGGEVAAGWARAARRRYATLPRRPRTVLLLADGLPPNPRPLLAARLTGTAHRVVAVVPEGAAGAVPRWVVAAPRVLSGDTELGPAEDVFGAAVIGVPPYYTNPLTPLRWLGARALSKARREVARRRLRPKDEPGLVRVGTDYGGWWVPRSVLAPDTIAYCAGAGEDISFDLALLRAGCAVRTLDPTPRAIAHVRRQAPDDPRFRFLPVGLWDSTTRLKFYKPDGEGVSHSAVNLAGTSEFFEADVRPLADVVAEQGDPRVDLLKIDIEGAEYRVIDSVLRDGPLPAVFCIEFDQPAPISRVVAARRSLAAAGYTLVRMDGWNLTFVH